MKRRVSSGRRIGQQIGPGIHSMREGNTMKCRRCNGMMVFEKFYGDSEYFFGWRCVACGEIVDQIILENRLESIR
jgi:DNA-directed RNA polymerase subunit RPC12/RpoP